MRMAGWKRRCALDELPSRVANLESQILLFRDEVRNEFSAVRTEMQALIGGVHTHMRVLQRRCDRPDDMGESTEFARYTYGTRIIIRICPSSR